MLAALVALAAACSSEPAAPTPNATITASSTAGVASTIETEPTAQPSLEELYQPVAFEERESGRTLTPTRIPPPSIRAANREATLWLEGYEALDAPESFVASAGSAEPRCVEVTSYERTRSGGFILDATLWADGRPMLDLEAANAAEALHGNNSPLVVRLRSLDETRATRVLEVRRLAGPAANWDLPFGLEPHDADWLLVANAGRNWGCFVVRVEVPGTASTSTIAEIEAAGSRAVVVPRGRDATFGASISGGPFEVPSERRCVEVERDPAFPIDGERTVSGEWLLASGDYEGRWRADWRAGERTIFVPLQQPEAGHGPEQPLTLEAVLLDDPRHTYSYLEVGGVYAGIRGGGSEAGYVTGFMLPRAGRWAVVARDGTNWDWGCFVLEVG
ncbi:MAG: hypothetical protein R3C39_02445 [Dehalococcoidia bacterium]